MIKTTWSVCAVLLSLSVVEAAVVSDEDVATRMSELLQNDHDYRGDADALFEECGRQSNRFVRIAQTLYGVRQLPRERTRLVAIIAKYSGTEDLPFLEDQVTDVTCGLPALTGVLRLQGLCSNSLAQLKRFHQVGLSTNLPPAFRWQSGLAVVDFLDNAVWLKSSAGDREMVWNYVLSYVSNNVDHVGVIDEALGRVDTTYRFSKRRLAFMRWIDTQVQSYNVKSYVTNAINAKLSYPEEDLPE